MNGLLLPCLFKFYHGQAGSQNFNGPFFENFFISQKNELESFWHKLMVKTSENQRLYGRNSNVSVCPKIQLFTRFRKIILCCFSMNFLCERTKLKMLGKYKVENILSSARTKKK